MHDFGPAGEVGALVGGLDVLVTKVLEVIALEEVVVVGIEEVAVAMQLHALLTRLATLPVQAATAKDGMALVAVTGEEVVKVPQNESAASSLSEARSARRQLSALQLAETPTAERSNGKSRECKRGILIAQTAKLILETDHGIRGGILSIYATQCRSSAGPDVCSCRNKFSWALANKAMIYP